jgi:DNA polymerase III epsilon subunit-like protein
VINNCNICCLDTETTGVDTRVDEVVQIGCVMVDPRSLTIIPNSEFNSLLRPVDIMSGTPSEIEVKWQRARGAFAINKLKRADLEKAPLPEHVFKAFAAHVARYNSGGTGPTARPIASGHNILSFDLPLIQRYCDKYKLLGADGKPKIFNSRTVLDTLHICFLWFENMSEPERLSMDLLREYFGISKDGAHTAIGDVKISAELLIRFMKVHRRYAPKVGFKGSFNQI